MPIYGYNVKEVLSAQSGADLSGSQYLFGVIGSNGQVTVAGDGEQADGVIYCWDVAPTAAGKTIGLARQGVCPVKAESAIAQGALVASSAAGRAVTAASGKQILGKALEPATAANQVIPVLLMLTGEATKA